MRAHNLGSNLALWHLSALEKFQLIRSKKIRNRCIFFIFDSDPKYDQLHYYLANNIVQSIIALMKNEKPLKITTIADSLKKNHNTVKRYLEALSDLKLVEIEQEKSRNLYKLNKERYLKAVKIARRG